MMTRTGMISIHMQTLIVAQTSVLVLGGGGAGACAQPEEPEPEPEPDPFAELGMAPTIGKTKRYNARDANVFGKPSQP